MEEQKEMFLTEEVKPEQDKKIKEIKCPICGELATVYRFGKGQGRISHHGHSVCFSSREVREMLKPVEPVDVKRNVDPVVKIEPVDEPLPLKFGVF